MIFPFPVTLNFQYFIVIGSLQFGDKIKIMKCTLRMSLNLIEFGLLVLKKKILKSKISVFLLFCYYLSLENGYPLRLINLNPLASHNDDLFQVWLKLAQWFWRRFLNDPTPIFTFL
jgi:hypothetical protein